MDSVPAVLWVRYKKIYLTSYSSIAAKTSTKKLSIEIIRHIQKTLKFDIETSQHLRHNAKPENEKCINNHLSVGRQLELKKKICFSFFSQYINRCSVSNEE